MSQTREIVASEWSGTETLRSNWDFSKKQGIPAVLFRFHNTLDVEVSLSVPRTDGDDNGLRNRESYATFWGSSFLGEPISRGTGALGNNGESITISSGAVDERISEQRWDVMDFEVTPTTAPSSGTFTIVLMDV